MPGGMRDALTLVGMAEPARLRCDPVGESLIAGGMRDARRFDGTVDWRTIELGK